MLGDVHQDLSLEIKVICMQICQAGNEGAHTHQQSRKLDTPLSEPFLNSALVGRPRSLPAAATAVPLVPSSSVGVLLAASLGRVPSVVRQLLPAALSDARRFPRLQRSQGGLNK